MIDTYITKIKNWIGHRLKERTTAECIVLIVAGIVYLIFKPIASLVAYAAIFYGGWTIYKKENKSDN